MKLSIWIPSCVLCVEILFCSSSTGEWIEMPQFSDEKKIYRIPSTKQDYFHKFAQRDNKNHSFQEEHRNDFYGNDTKIVHTIFDENLSLISDIKSKEAFDGTTDRIFNESPQQDVTQVVEEDTEEPDITIEDEVEEEGHYNESVNTKEEGIFDYLPVKVLRNVHKTLKSQPVTTEGKIQFLKAFEKTLMAEVESRLDSTMAVSRRKRGGDHYDHGYDDHDGHAVGFPSVEGALMAISFLTFAVYLVRLVMLLFRNMNNTVQTTTGATLFLGRRRRSVDQFNDDTARILGSVDNFISSLQ